MKKDEASTDISQIGDNTELIHKMTEKIESAQQALIKDTMENKAAGFRSLRKEMNRSIATSLERHLKEHFGSLTVAQGNRPQIPKDTGDCRHDRLTATAKTDPVQYQSHDKEFICSSLEHI